MTITGRVEEAGTAGSLSAFAAPAKQPQASARRRKIENRRVLRIGCAHRITSHNIAIPLPSEPRRIAALPAELSLLLFQRGRTAGQAGKPVETPLVLALLIGLNPFRTELARPGCLLLALALVAIEGNAKPAGISYISDFHDDDGADGHERREKIFQFR